MSSVGERIAARVLPPRRGSVAALTVDATARAYALGSIAMGGYTPEAAASLRNEVYVTLQADGAAIYYYFSTSNTADLDPTAAVAAGGTLAYANAHGAVIEDGTSAQVVVDRSRDEYIVVRTASGSSTLRLYASSEAV